MRMPDSKPIDKISEAIKGIDPKIIEAIKKVVGVDDKKFHETSEEQIRILLQTMHREEGDPMPMVIVEMEDELHCYGLANFGCLKTSDAQRKFMFMMGTSIGQEKKRVSMVFFTSLAWFATLPATDCLPHSMQAAPSEQACRQEMLTIAGGTIGGKCFHLAIPTNRNPDNPEAEPTKYPSFDEVMKGMEYTTMGSKYQNYLLEHWWAGFSMAFLGNGDELMETIKKLKDLGR